MLWQTCSWLFCLLGCTIIIQAAEVFEVNFYCDNEYQFEEGDEDPVILEYKGAYIGETCKLPFRSKPKSHYNVQICAEVERFDIVNPDTTWLEYHELNYFSGSADKIYNQRNPPDGEWCSDDLWDRMYVAFETGDQPNGQDYIRVKVFQKFYPDMTSWFWKGIIIGSAGAGVMILGGLFYLAKYFFLRARQRQREAYYDKHFPRRDQAQAGESSTEKQAESTELCQLRSTGGQDPNTAGTQPET